jgi:hypothetical protein
VHSRPPDGPWIITLDDFVSADEAAAFIETTDHHFQRSLAGDVISPVRTSQQESEPPALPQGKSRRSHRRCLDRADVPPATHPPTQPPPPYDVDSCAQPTHPPTPTHCAGLVPARPRRQLLLAPAHQSCPRPRRQRHRRAKRKRGVFPGAACAGTGGGGGREGGGCGRRKGDGIACAGGWCEGRW